MDGKALPMGTVTDWAEKRPQMVAQWRADLNGGIDISQVRFRTAFPRSPFTGPVNGDTPGGKTPYKRNDLPAGKWPKWKRLARTRAACRECVIEDHAPRYTCGHPERRLDLLGALLIPKPCDTCLEVLQHTHACGRTRKVRAAETPAPEEQCPQCQKVERQLADGEDLARRLRRMAVAASLPATSHDRVTWWCTTDGHPQFVNDLFGVVKGFGCRVCFKMATTAGASIDPGKAFLSRLRPPGSQTENRFREMLAERLRVANPAKINAISIHGDFFGRGEVYPDIIIPALRVAIEVDSPGRHRDLHVGPRAEADRIKDRKLGEVGWRVIRVRLAGLPPVDSAECILGKSASRAVVEEVIRLIDQHSGD